jgi:hypothetical protein
MEIPKFAFIGSIGAAWVAATTLQIAAERAPGSSLHGQLPSVTNV